MRGACAGCGGKRLELEHTDVEALTDVSGTDASVAQACAAVWTCTCVSLRFCVQYLCVHVVVFTVYLLLYAYRFSFVWAYVTPTSVSQLHTWVIYILVPLLQYVLTVLEFLFIYLSFHGH